MIHLGIYGVGTSTGTCFTTELFMYLSFCSWYSNQLILALKLSALQLNRRLPWALAQSDPRKVPERDSATFVMPTVSAKFFNTVGLFSTAVSLINRLITAKSESMVVAILVLCLGKEKVLSLRVTETFSEVLSFTTVSALGIDLRWQASVKIEISNMVRILFTFLCGFSNSCTNQTCYNKPLSNYL